MFNIFKKINNKESLTGKDKSKKDVELKTAAVVVMVNMAYADTDFSDEERGYIKQLLQKDFSLTAKEVKDIIEEAENFIKEDTNKWRYINKINREYSNAYKEELLLKLWKLIYRDDKLDKYEDSLMHSIVKMLHIPHKKMIELKVKAMKKEK